MGIYLLAGSLIVSINTLSAMDSFVQLAQMLPQVKGIVSALFAEQPKPEWDVFPLEHIKAYSFKDLYAYASKGNTEYIVHFVPIIRRSRIMLMSKGIRLRPLQLLAI